MHSRAWTGGRSRVRAGPADPTQALGGVAGGGSARRFGGLPPTFGPELRDSAADRGFPGRNYLEKGNHYSHQYYCCMCSSQLAWTSGVQAYLGLPVGGSGSERLTKYASVVFQNDAGCSTDLDDSGEIVNVFFDYLQYFCSPGNAYGTRNFEARHCYRADEAAPAEEDQVYDANLLTCA